MPRTRTFASALLCLAALPGTLSTPGPVVAQSASAAPAAIGPQLEAQFESAARRVVALAEAMPAETYGWAPMEGVQTVASAYMHIARYNYMYPETSLGVERPAGTPYESWEEEVGEKERVVALLSASMDHVRGVLASMSEEELAEATTLYGREVPRWAVILQLVTHMNQHLGQEIAYARSNGVVPPWSR